VIYGSVCSGIEGASVAWEPLGWRASFFAEIDKQPAAVLAHRFPKVRNAGDFTKIQSPDFDPIDLLVGGTPCQSFSLAGLRKGMDDPRGNLALGFLGAAERLRPRWVVWENVPGVLSSNSGRDFGCFLGGLVALGYGVAWRVLDAQYVCVAGLPRAVAQRRNRVFVVGCAGDWRGAVSVLFDRAGLSGNPPPRRQAGQEIAGPIGGSAQSGGFRTTDLDNHGTYIPEIVPQAISSKWAKGVSGPAGDEVANLIAFGAKDSDPKAWADVAPTLRSMSEGATAQNGGGQVAIPLLEVGARTGRDGHENRDGLGIGRDGDPMFSLQASKQQHGIAALGGGNPTWRVRRLTPRECERLQGFPDDWTLVPFGKKLMADGPRYKMIGNAFPVNSIRWIGQRIELYEALNG
jgi:DNA (cytosine-5)-methyltransferase 1